MKSRIRLISASCLGFTQLSLTLLTLPAFANSELLAQSNAAERLQQSFSPEIQSTINACADQGRVDLTAGANPDGSLACGDGSQGSTIAYADYLDTVSNFLAASFLVGVKAAMESDRRITPEMLVTYLASAEGETMLRTSIENAIAQIQLLSADEPESLALLTDAVITRITPTLQNANSLSTLLGTAEQYSQVVSNFCTPPGMSVAAARSTLPGLTPIQLFAICVQDSGVADEVMQMPR